MNIKKIVLMMSVLVCAALLFSCGDSQSDTQGTTAADTLMGENTMEPLNTAEDPIHTDSEVGDFGSDSTSVEIPPAPETTKQPEVTQDKENLSALEGRALDYCTRVYDAAVKGETLASDAVSAEMASKWSDTYGVISREMQRFYVKFNNGDISYDNFVCLMKSFAAIDSAKGLSDGYIKLAEVKRNDIDHLKAAKQSADNGKYLSAAISLSKVSGTDSASRGEARDLIGGALDSFKGGITDAVTQYMVRYELSEGRAFLEALRGYGIDSYIDSECARLEEYRKFQEDDLEEVVLWDTLENIYTHCLIAFPEINFATQSTYGNCGTDCLTPDEFRFLLQSLYDRGYIIIDANIVYDSENDTFFKKIKLPKGKKPLIFTFDDVTYDYRKMGRGMVDRLIVDDEGRVCTYTKHKDGTEVVSYDNELFPIIDNFVRSHPDFTFQGARGTLFFTGFDGICGYRTQSEPVNDKEAALGLDRQAEISAAKVVIEALREEGWTFGSHGYNHSRMSTISYASFCRELDMWREEVGSIVGDTGLFCWPYGDHGGGALRKGDAHKYAFELGFNFFFGCGSQRYIANETDGLGIFSDRKGITGQVLVYIEAGYKSYVRDYPYLFDTEKIWDKYRLPYKQWLLSKV
ncbi:MAG: polysaccharide deacetylase family protein [Clostridia bacterium]|nr:polysaccharide deacetylase family protein [Clostridia bacterium]